MDLIDNELYSTDSYEMYTLYNALFFVEKKIEVLPSERSPFECRSLANGESWLKGLEQEKKRYENGYKFVKGNWVKNKEVF